MSRMKYPPITINWCNEDMNNQGHFEKFNWNTFSKKFKELAGADFKGLCRKLCHEKVGRKEDADSMCQKIMDICNDDEYGMVLSEEDLEYESSDIFYTNLINRYLKDIMSSGRLDK